MDKEDKISKETIEKIREFMRLDNEYSGMRDFVRGTVRRTLHKVGCVEKEDEIFLGDYSSATLEEFVDVLYGSFTEAFIRILELEN